MKRILSILTMISLSALLGFSSKAQTENTAEQAPSFKSVSVEEFESAIADSCVIRLDVRTAEEYAEGHIEGAVNIDVLKNTFKKTAVEALPKDKTIALYCRSGRRSKTAAGMLSKAGYTVLDLDKGYQGWVDSGRPVVK